MTTTTTLVIYMCTLFIPALVAALIFPKVSRVYYPVLIFLLTLFLLDLAQHYFIRGEFGLDAAMHFQHLSEIFLISWQVKNWGSFSGKPWVYPLLLVSLFAFWLVDMFLIQDNQQKTSWFLVVYSLTISALAILVLIRTYLAPGKTYRREKMLFCISWIFYFTLTALIEIMMNFGQFRTLESIQTVYSYYLIIGIITNLINLTAVLCIPRNKMISSS